MTSVQEAEAPERWSLAEQDSLWETSLYDLRTWEVNTETFLIFNIVFHLI